MKNDMNQDEKNKRAFDRASDTKPNILLVDDDKFLLDMYAMKFTQQGYCVQACLSVSDALGVLHGEFTPGAILFDITMPERDGFSFLQALRDEHLAPNALRIALTNQSDDAEKAKATSLGVELYLIKASTIPSEVVNTVGEALAKRSAHA